MDPYGTSLHGLDTLITVKYEISQEKAVPRLPKLLYALSSNILWQSRGPWRMICLSRFFNSGGLQQDVICQVFQTEILMVWHQFMSDCYQTVSRTLCHRDEVIKFWKVTVGGGGMRSTEPF